jgi:hypothetical protein
MPTRLPAAPSAAAFLAVLLALPGCEDAAAPPALEELPERPARETLRVEVTLSAAGAVDLTRGPDGVLYLLDGGARVVRTLSASGEGTGTLGRGGGSGALQDPVRLGWDEGGLWVWDAGRDRLVHYDAGGGVASVEDAPEPRAPTGVPQDGETYRIEAPLPGGGWLAVPAPDARLRAARDGYRMPVVRVDREGEIRDTLWHVGYRESGWPIHFEGGESFYEENPFDAAPVRAVDRARGEVVEARHELVPEPRLVVERRPLEGGSPRSIFIAFRPDPLTAEEVDEAIQFHVERLGTRIQGRSSLERRAAAREWLEAPDVRRPVQAILVGADGTLWLRLSPIAREGGLGPVPLGDPRTPPGRLRGDAGGSRWLVLSPSGEPLARATLPPGFEPLHAEGRRVLGIERIGPGSAALVELELEGAGEGRSPA